MYVCTLSLVMTVSLVVHPCDSRNPHKEHISNEEICNTYLCTFHPLKGGHLYNEKICLGLSDVLFKGVSLYLEQSKMCSYREKHMPTAHLLSPDPRLVTS